MGPQKSVIERLVGLFRFQDAPQLPDYQPKTQAHPIGSSGTEIYSGYYAEEYIDALTGPRAALVWDKLRRSDPKIKMVLNAVKNPLRGANWEIEPWDDSSEAEEQAEFIEHCLFYGMEKTWQETLGEILTYLEFGFSVFEKVHMPVIGHRDFGDYVGIRRLAFRSQKTIERWLLDHETGKLEGIEQYAYGDLERVVKIPGEFLLVFSHDKEGDNYEGISALRPCYGPWLRKQTYQKLQAIGVEKYAVPTPIGKFPANKFKSKEYDNFVAALRAYTSNESNSITLPEGWEIELKGNEFDASKVQVVIDAEDKQIVFAFLANFLELGTSGTGSYALSFDLSDFFLGGIEHIAEYVACQINQSIIKDLILLNYGPQPGYPTLKASGISDKAGKELAEVVKLLTESKAIIPDDRLEEHLRKRFDLPEKSDECQREMTPPPLPGQNPSERPGEKENPEPESNPEPAPNAASKPEPKAPKLAEKKSLEIKGSKERMKSLMEEGISEIGSDLIAQIMRKYRAATPAQRAAIVKQVEPRKLGDYQNKLKELLAEIASDALEKAKKEVPAKRNLKFADSFDGLPPKIKKKIALQASLLSSTQAGDLAKVIYFQFQNSVDSTDSADLIEKDLTGSLETYIAGPSVNAASGNVVAFTVNTARNAFFFEPEVLDTIESFTFVNDDPQSEICMDLAGKTFPANDPESERYFPPLHHNCQSYLVPNLKGRTGNPGVSDTGLKPSSPDLEKYITLSEQDCVSCKSHS